MTRLALIDLPQPEDIKAIGRFIYEFGKLEITIDDALAEAVIILQAIDPASRVPHRLDRRVQMLLTFHRTRSPMKACRSDAEPLLVEIKSLLPVRNNIVHGRSGEYHGHSEYLAARTAVLNDELIRAMKWRALQAV